MHLHSGNRNRFLTIFNLLLLVQFFPGHGFSAPLKQPDAQESSKMPPTVVIHADKDWVPLNLELDIEAGSALDFSRMGLQWGPAGNLGRVIARPDGQFAFEKDPQTPRRFYGINLCVNAQYLSHADSDVWRTVWPAWATTRSAFITMSATWCQAKK